MIDGAGDPLFLLSGDVSLRWMITLLHFLWQGTMVGCVVAIAAVSLRRYSARLRHALYSVALLSLPLCVATTFVVVQLPENLQPAAEPATFAKVTTSGVVTDTPALPAISSPFPAAFAPPMDPATSAFPESQSHIAAAESIADAQPFLMTLARMAPWIDFSYVIGVCCFLLRLGVALWGGHRLRAGATRLADAGLLELIADQARSVGLRSVPVIAYCDRVVVPTVIGILRPMVLLPATIMTGLSPDEFSAIISHELAHIRRYDLWINLLQRVIESLLFFHPVVWFISRRLSAEREVCCDDLVVSSGNPPMNYAGALLRMAELCTISQHANVTGLAASGKDSCLLEHRIQRLISNTGRAPNLQLTRVGVLTLMLSLIALIAIPGIVHNWAQADEPPVISDSNAGKAAARNDSPADPPQDPSAWGVVDDTKPDVVPPVPETDTVKIKYPYCIVNVDDLQNRPLAGAISTFNREALESPIGQKQPPITEQETRDAIAKFIEQNHVPETVKAKAREIAATGVLPKKAYFRRFTRFDDERQMHGVWWVRLVLEGPDPPVYSVRVRTTPIFTRPYTQMERQQNAEEGLTLINRFCSYFENLPTYRNPKPLPQESIDRLINQVQQAVQAKDLESLLARFEWKGASNSTRDFVKTELQMLLQSKIHSIRVTPNFLEYKKIFHWSAWHSYQPNLPVLGHLEFEYTPADDKFEQRKTLSLELGLWGSELRLVNYTELGEPDLPKGPINVSIRGHVEPLADGTYYATDVITNPGSLLSAHLANEEIRLRNSDHRIIDDTAPVINRPPESLNDSQDPDSSKVPASASIRIHYDIPGSEARSLITVFHHGRNEYIGTEEPWPGSVRANPIRNGGSLELKDLTPGDYEVARCRKVAGHGRYLDRQRFQLAAGESKSIDFSRPGARQVSGRILNLNGLKLEATLVSVLPETTRDVKLADWGEFMRQDVFDFRICEVGGTFTTNPLVPGKYVILVEGFEPLRQSVAGLGIQRPRFMAKAEITVPESSAAPNVEVTLKDMYEDIDWIQYTSGKFALTFIDDLKPAWSKAQEGIEFGVSHVGDQRRFLAGQRVPLVMFIRNVGDRTLKVNLTADFQSNGPEIRDAQGQIVQLELLDPGTKYSGYHETLKPGEAFGFRTYGLGLGDNPRPKEQNWFNPWWKEPVVGNYTLRQRKEITIEPLGEPASARTEEFATGTIDFEVVEQPVKAAGVSTNAGPREEKGNNRFRILDHSGKPVANATIRMIHQSETYRELVEHKLRYETNTDQDGYFELPAGSRMANPMDDGGLSAVWVTVPTRGENPEKTWLLGTSAGVICPEIESIFALFDGQGTITAGDRPTEKKPLNSLPTVFQLPQSQVTLRVINADGTPAVGVEVTPSQIAWIYRGASIKPIVVPEILRASLRQTTDASGKVLFDTIQQKEFTEIEFRSVRHGLQRTFTNANTIGPELGQDVMLFPVGKVAGRVIAGRALHQKSLHGHDLLLQSKAVNTGLPVPKGSHLTLEGFANVTLNDNGEFEIPAMLAGELTLTDRSTDDAVTRVVFPNRSVIKAGETMKVEGRVISAVTVTGVLRKRETNEPVESAAISIRHGGPRSGLSRELTVYARTDVQGRFSANVFPGRIGFTSMTVVEGTVAAHFWEQDWDAEWPYGKHVTVPDNVDSFELPPLELVPVQSISGKVIDAVGNPVAKTGVYAKSRKQQSGNDFSMTNEAGEFTLSQFPAGYSPDYCMVGEQSKTQVARILSRKPLVLQVP